MKKWMKKWMENTWSRLYSLGETILPGMVGVCEILMVIFWIVALIFLVVAALVIGVLLGLVIVLFFGFFIAIIEAVRLLI